MKDEKRFIKPDLEICEFVDEDIILTSNGLGGADVDEIIGG